MSKNQAFKDEVRRTNSLVKEHQDNNDYDNILDRFDFIRRSQAIRDIVVSERLPFTTEIEPSDIEANEKISTVVFPPLEVARLTGVKLDDIPQQSRLFQAKSPTKNTSNNLNTNTSTTTSTNKEKLLSSSKSNKSLLNDSNITSNNNKSTMKKTVSKPKLKFMSLEENPEDKKVDALLQYIVELMAKAKTDHNPSKLLFECAQIFERLHFYDRAIACYQKACKPSNSEIIVDQILLPNDEKYQRKVKFMSPTVLPAFLKQRTQQRNQLIYEESERQRLRKRQCHCELAKLYALMLSVQDYWKSHEHIVLAFETCKDNQEHNELLFYFHTLLREHSVLMKGKPEFNTIDQMIRSSAGPLSDTHVNVLLELQELEPDNAEFQEWLGKRYAEKCEFDHSLTHYKSARDIRKLRPDMQDTLTLWRKPLPKPKNIRVPFAESGKSDAYNFTTQPNAFTMNKQLGDLPRGEDEETEQLKFQVEADLKKTPYTYFDTDGTFDEQADETLTMSISRKEYQTCYRQRNSQYYLALKRNEPLPSFTMTGSNYKGEFGTTLISGGGNQHHSANLTAASSFSSAGQILSHSGSWNNDNNGTVAGNGKYQMVIGKGLSAFGSSTFDSDGSENSVLIPKKKCVPLTEEEINSRDFSWFRGRHEDASTILFLPPPQGWSLGTST